MHVRRFIGWSLAVVVGFAKHGGAQELALTSTPTTLIFGGQNVGTSITQSLTLNNSGSGPLVIARMVLSGTFYGDFAVSMPNGCLTTLLTGSNCTIGITFTPTGTGTRAAKLVIYGISGGSQIVGITGTGVGTCTNVSDCSYQLLNRRVTANQTGFFVYQDGDSAFNHGYPSGLFGTIDLTRVLISSACLDDPTSATGCSTDAMAQDGTRGTVFSFTYPALSAGDFVGLNFVDPENYDGVAVIGNGYNLTPATAVQFEARSPGPTPATVQFGVGGCVSGFMPLTSAWSQITIPIDTLFPPSGAEPYFCPPDLSRVHILFSVSANGVNSPAGGTVLLDNIQFVPVPARQMLHAEGPILDSKALSFPLGDQVLGVVPTMVTVTTPMPDIQPDQINRNFAAIYESSATLLALLKRGHPDDVANALEIADAFDYALHHENSGDPLPVASDGSVGLHNAYQGGDIGFLNTLPGDGAARSGDARLAGFSSYTGFCDGFCLVLDGASPGNNAWAILALAAAYLQTTTASTKTDMDGTGLRRGARPGNLKYLDDAETIGRWIVGTMLDRTGTGYGGYFVGFPDYGVKLKTVTQGKSTENNADVFAAFSLLAEIETQRGNHAAAAWWTQNAKFGGDFVVAMFDKANGRFNAGTVSAWPPSPPDMPGNCQTPYIIEGNDILNTCDFLDSTTFTALAMAGSSQYPIGDWNMALNYVLNPNLLPPQSFTQSVTDQGQTFNGFDIVPGVCTPDPCPTPPPSMGITWEFTGQVSATCEYLYVLLSVPAFQNCSQTYQAQIAQAQKHASFGDGSGLPSSTLANGDSLATLAQCLNSPFQCFPERVGLAATAWSIFSDQQLNPLAYAALGLSNSALMFASEPLGTAAPRLTVTITSRGIAPVANMRISITGPNAGDFSEQDTCPQAAPLASGATCTVTIAFTPNGPGARTATLEILDNALGSPQICSLRATGVPAQDFSLSVTTPPQAIVQGNTASYTVAAAGNAQSITLSATSQPPGLTLTLNPNTISPGGSATLTVSSSLSAAPTFYTITITGTGPSGTHQASAELEVSTAGTVSPANLIFPVQTLDTTSAAQQVSLTNGSVASLNLSASVLTGSFYGDYTETDNCGGTLAAGSSCTLSVSFRPSGTGTRAATLLLLGAGGTSIAAVALSGTGVGSCTSVSDCAYSLLTQRATANQNAFWVFRDGDSGLNEGFASGVFPAEYGNSVMINSGCIDDPTSASGCSMSSSSLDGTRGTVIQIVFPALPPLGFVGLDFQDPENYDSMSNVGKGYNLLGATAIEFDVRSPDMAMVQFGASNCVSPTFMVGPTWSHMKIPLNSLTVPFGVYPPPTCPPDPQGVNLVFVVQTTTATLSQGQETVLLDNIQYTPTPLAQQNNSLGLPVSTQTFGVVPQQTLPIPTDQVNRNLATVYESALNILALLNRDQGQDSSNALRVAQTLDYSLDHDNHGDPVPTAPGSTNGCFAGIQAQQCGFHSAYIDGNISFLNSQKPPELGQAGDVRLAGFSAGQALCGTSKFCLVLDGASGGDNAWAILAFLAAYRKSGQAMYLNDALAIANWIVANLVDASGYGGYFVGYSDGGRPKQRILGKATAQNAQIFAALSQLSQVEAGLGDAAQALRWAKNASIAGDFVVRMFDHVNGRFYAGTIYYYPDATTTGPGSCPDTSSQLGHEVINTCDSLDSDTFSTLALAASQPYQGVIDWTQPIDYALNHFSQSITAGGHSFSGLDLVPVPTVGANGVAWEYTGQTVTAIEMLDQLLPGSPFQVNAKLLLGQIQAAQAAAPFGDGQGLVASTLQAGDTQPPAQQCLATPFACIPERVGIASTAWALFAALNVNPLIAPIGQP